MEQSEKHLAPAARAHHLHLAFLTSRAAVTRKTGSMAVAAVAHCCVTDAMASTAASRCVPVGDTSNNMLVRVLLLVLGQMMVAAASMAWGSVVMTVTVAVAAAVMMSVRGRGGRGSIRRGASVVVASSVTAHIGRRTGRAAVGGRSGRQARSRRRPTHARRCFCRTAWACACA